MRKQISCFFLLALVMGTRPPLQGYSINSQHADEVEQRLSSDLIEDFTERSVVRVEWTHRGMLRGEESVHRRYHLLYHRASEVLHQQEASYVRLIDGSLWQVAASDQERVKQWRAQDIIEIKNNHAWWPETGFSYQLANYTTGNCVKVKLTEFGDPNLDNRCMDTLDSFSPSDCLLELSHDTRWKIESQDIKIVAGWEAGDMIVIGFNDGFLTGPCPNILINLSKENSARAFWWPR